MNGGAMEAPIVQMNRRPNDFRMEFTVQGMTGVQAFDGSGGVAWAISPFMGKKEPETAPAEETKLVADESDFDGALIDWKEKGHQLELVGKEQVEGADAFKLKLTRKSGTIEYVYIDAETGLEVKSEQKRVMRGTEVETETYMSDFKEVDGIPFPHTLSMGGKGSAENQRQKIVFEKVELNVAMNDTLFKVPANAVKASAAPKDTTKAAAKTTGKPADAKPAADAKTAAKKK
jgi:outer membrane lipoprotein-sorting protein